MIQTASYLPLQEGFDTTLLQKWDELANSSSSEWARLIGEANVLVEPDEDELIDDDDILR